MTDHDDLTNTLARELDDRAHTMDGSTVHLADVRGRARSIRRRRTATAVAGVATAVAVIVPVAALAARSGGNPQPAPAPATQTPSQTKSPTADEGHQPPPGVLDVSDLPTGARPRMDYVTDGRVLHQVDGSTLDIGTRYPVTSFATLADGAHVWQTADKAGNAYVEIEDAEGTVHKPLDSYFGLAVNDEHNVAGWVANNGQVTIWTVGASEPRPVGDPVPGTHDLRIAAIPSQDCRDFCTVYVNGPSADDQSLQPYEVTDDGTQPYTDGGLVAVNDVSGALTVGFSRITDSGSCSDLFGGGEFQGFTTCKATLKSFSPDGSSLLGYPAYYDGLGPTTISMWDLKDHRLFERRSDARHQATVGDAQWEASTDVLGTVFQDGTWSIVRFASDGSVEYAVPPVAGDDVENPFVLTLGGMSYGD
jgi:hypothetical protein